MCYHVKFQNLVCSDYRHIPAIIAARKLSLVLQKLFSFTLHSTRQAKAAVGHDETEPVSIMHPEAAKAESIIRNAWAESKLVAD